MTSRLTCAICLLALACTLPCVARGQQGEERSILRMGGTDGREYTVEEIGSWCVQFETLEEGSGAFDYRECRVSESGEFGQADGKRYYYATYCLMPNDAKKESKCGDGSYDALFNSHRGQVVFAGDIQSGRATVLFRLIGTGPGDVTFGRKPLIARHAGETLLVLPVAQDGTANINRSVYFVLRGGKWEPIDGRTWEDGLVKRLPAGRWIGKGIWPDLKSMTATVHLYQLGDVNCCPTGGVARVRLGLRGTKLVMEHAKFEVAKE